MSQITFPQFSDMQPVADDLQLIIDSLRTEARNRLTADGIFNPGIVGQKSDYLSLSTNNTIKVKPFIAYTQNGNRIELSTALDQLSPQGSVINITSNNILNEYVDIPVWSKYIFDYDNYLSDQNIVEKSFTIKKLGKGSILHGIKLRTNSTFTSLEGNPNITVCIGTETEPDKFLPETLVSDSNASNNISVMNLMYSIDDDNDTDIKITFRSDSLTLSQLNAGVLTVNLCIANLSGFENEVQTTGGYVLNSGAANWQASTLYYIVARYKETESDFRNLVYKDNNGVTITTNPFAARITTNYQLYALRKSGSSIDSSTLDDVKLGELRTDEDGKIYSLNINGKNADGEDYTQYLTIPGYRIITNIDATQISDGSVSNTQFNFLNTLTSNVQTQLNSKASLDSDNIFNGINKFTTQIDGDIKTVNGYTAFATPTSNSLLVLDENGKIPAEAVSESTLMGVANVYTVSSGVTTNGRSSYMTANGNKDGVILAATEDNPLIFNYPDGSTEKITSDQTIDGLAADGHYYVIKEKDGNFIFLPTSGGTVATIPVVATNNSFIYNGNTGTVQNAVSGYNNTTYKAFDGTLNSYTQLGNVKYFYYNNIERFTGTPTTTYLQIDFPEAITPTGFAACFRVTNKTVCTPKIWYLRASNDEWDNYDELATATNESWNPNEIKTTHISTVTAYKSFRFVFNVSESSVNNYVQGEETPQLGINIPINCYYFQIYANNTDTSNKGNVTEGYTFPINPIVGSYHLDISKKPFVGYKATGSTGEDAWTKVNFVKLGFVNLTEYGTINPNLVCSPFCYNTFTISDDDCFVSPNTNILTENTPITFNHNLGVKPNIIDIKFECINAINGYNVGDIVSDIWTKDTQGLRSVKSIISTSITSIEIYPCFTGDDFYIIDNDTGSATYRKLTTTTGSSWKAIIYCARGW